MRKISDVEQETIAGYRNVRKTDDRNENNKTKKKDKLIPMNNGDSVRQMQTTSCTNLSSIETTKNKKENKRERIRCGDINPYSTLEENLINL